MCTEADLVKNISQIYKRFRDYQKYIWNIDKNGLWQSYKDIINVPNIKEDVVYADINGDGKINQLDYNKRNSSNSRRFQVALRKAEFANQNKANVYDELFNAETTILLDKDFQLNPYKNNFI